MRLMRALIALLAIPLLSVTGLAAQPAGAGKAVEKLHETLIDVMKRSPDLGYAGRYAALEPVVNASFDFPTISRIVVGRHWSGLNPEQQKQFMEAFARFSTATYASRFDSHSGESFRQVSEEKQSGNKVLVKTELVKSNGSTVELDYLMQPGKDNQWRILNVIADGISDLSLKRSEYASIIEAEGFTALIDKLNAKIAQYEAPVAAAGR